jgi:uncharacterized protein involved in exopolysaccharide biosynthesis
MQDDQKPILRLPEARGLEKVREHGAPLPPYTGYTSAGDMGGDEENHFRNYLRAVRKHLWLIIGITLIVTSLVTISVARKPDIFLAQARVQVDLESNPAGGATKSGTVVINSPTSDPAYFNTQLQNLTSLGLLRRVVKTLDLEHNDAFLRADKEQNRSTWQSILRMFGLGKKDEDKKEQADDALPLTTSVAPATARTDLVEAKRLEPFVRMLQANLKVEPVKEIRTSSYSKDTRLIDISFSHTDPQVLKLSTR